MIDRDRTSIAIAHTSRVGHGASVCCDDGRSCRIGDIKSIMIPDRILGDIAARGPDKCPGAGPSRYDLRSNTRAYNRLFLLNHSLWHVDGLTDVERKRIKIGKIIKWKVYDTLRFSLIFFCDGVNGVSCSHFVY